MQDHDRRRGGAEAATLHRRPSVARRSVAPSSVGRSIDDAESGAMTESNPTIDPSRFDSIEQLVERYGESMTRLATRLLGNRADANDVVQELLVRLIERGSSHRGDGPFEAWLAAAVVNRCRSYRRSFSRRISALIRLFERSTSDPKPVEKPTDSLARGERRRAVVDAVDRLPDDLRETVILGYFEQLDSKTVGAILGLTPNAVDVRLHRARSILKERLVEWRDE